TLLINVVCGSCRLFHILVEDSLNTDVKHESWIKETSVSIVVINALSVPAGQENELEKRFAARNPAVDKSTGCDGFQLLRPSGENNQGFVYTQWASREDFENWRSSRDSSAAHASEDGTPRQPVATGAELLEFDIVEL